MKTWFEILSELFVNVAAGWFGAVFIETQLNEINTIQEFLLLIFRFFLGIISLFAAKYFRQKSRRKK